MKNKEFLGKYELPLPTITLESCRPNSLRFMPQYIKGIYVDETKRTVAVRFNDRNNSVEKIKCSEEDEFDPAIGAALAICRHLFGHTGFYKHVVAKKTTYVKKNNPTEYEQYKEWSKKNNCRLVSETTFKKNRTKYLKKMKEEK